MNLDDEFKSLIIDHHKQAVRERKQLQRQRKADGIVLTYQSKEDRKMKRREASKHRKQENKKERLDNIAVLDMETDPFDNLHQDLIRPFAACLHSDKFTTIMIWDENYEAFIEKLIEAFKSLKGKFTIYAHNGGRFDFMFLVHKLRGPVSFKGRGIMAAEICGHDLRDSFHIIPEKLASYKKQDFDYEKMRKGKRNKYKKEIQEYLLSDCIYLLDIVKTFLQNYGFKISIGQAAMALLKKEYPQCKNLHEADDAYIRNFFYGGRVECLQGAGEWEGDFKLYDVNSMYPAVMTNRSHPIGREYLTRGGLPDDATCFVDLNCFSHGAFPTRREGLGTLFPHEYGRYFVSIHEYKTAKKLHLIRDETINSVIDNAVQTNFENFILPLYNNRLITKEKLGQFKRDGKVDTPEYDEVKKDDIFFKLLMNNAYGKFAQNPRRFKEYYLTDWNGVPSDEPETWGEFPSDVCESYAIWSRPIKKFRFNNVGTAASITGAARAVLLEAIHNSKGAIYCDTDSLICRELTNSNLHATQLGAWDCEAEISKIMIAGKKLYSYQKKDGKQIIKSKGVANLTWDEMLQLVAGQELKMRAFAPSLTRDGQQRYIDRKIHATAKRMI